MSKCGKTCLDAGRPLLQYRCTVASPGIEGKGKGHSTHLYSTDVGYFTMVSKPLVSLNDDGDNEVEECAWVPATQNWGQPSTNKILLSALGYQEQGSALVNRRSLVSLC